MELLFAVIFKLHILVMSVFIDSVTGVWDVQYNAFSRRLSREVF